VRGRARGERGRRGEYLVEAALAQVEILERPDQELGSAGLEERGVAAFGGIDHLLRAVDRGQAAGLEALAYVRRRDPVSAADLQDSVIGPDVEPLDYLP
jgi:hypothetical protein